jgi:FkbM family methyltransferase
MRANPGPSPWQALKRTVTATNPVVVQAGAHTGAEIRYFKAMWPRCTIYAFEPLPGPFAELKQKAKRWHNGVTTLQVALADTRHNLSMHVAHLEGTSSLYPINEDSPYFRADYTEKAQIEVKAVTLDWFLEAGTDYKTIDLLYADTQGSELRILKGAERLLSEHRIGALFLEVFFVDLYQNVPLFRDIRQELDKYGYELEGLYKVAKWGGTGQTMWADALFTKGD